VLVTAGLLPWIKAADIQPSIKGSDHCPVFVDLHDEITTDAGEKLVLCDLMHMGVDSAKREPPRLAVKYWPEFQGKQMLMSNFFTKRGAEVPPPPPTASANAPSPLATAFDALNKQPQPVSVEGQSASKAPQLSSSSQTDTEPSSSQSPMSAISTQAPLKLSQESHESHKRPYAGTSTATGPSKQKKLKAGQSKLSSFFTKPTTAPTAPGNAQPSNRAGSWSSEIIDLCDESEEIEIQSSPLPTFTSEIRLPADNPTSSQSRRENGNGKAGGAAASSWSAVFVPIPPPLCAVHREPAKEFRVNKPGPNKGKTFYLCARPVGPGYDKGHHERLREEVDHQYKCNFFMWASDAKREAMAMRAGGGGGVAGVAAKQGTRSECV
jgi:AP endonuclease-2